VWGGIVIGRMRAAFGLERVARRFYERLRSERDAFMLFVQGIPADRLRRWYVSVTLNRLMCVYFIQKKKFLDGDPDYLRTKLAQSQQRGADCYYREFLCPLFFEGLAMREAERCPEIKRLLGCVPYLSGGIFACHPLEERYRQSIQIADVAFEQLFAFFDAYRWNLDDGRMRGDEPTFMPQSVCADDEVTTDVLGYILEKYINQKQMGAYYTQEDITGYISTYTVLPYLLDRVRQYCQMAFEGEHSVWQLLQADPDRYIYPAVRHGAALSLPPTIALGLDTSRLGLLERRGAWNEPAPEDYALPTETWREVMARRQHCEQVRRKLASGEVRSTSDLVTYNLDIQQFVQDMVEGSTGPELASSFWRVLEESRILDPTVGSGAFLLAALNVLEPLYEACLDRMQSLVEEVDRCGAKHHPPELANFRQTLADAARYPSRRYYILKMIIVQNLYGVDIMEEAVEICKLRLLLRLVAQVERVEDIEPLPDIDFNLRVGNTLVGFSSLEQLQHALTTGSMDLMTMPMVEITAQVKRIREHAEIADHAREQFQLQQLGKSVRTPAGKAALQARLDVLNQGLHRVLARTYGVDPDGPSYGPWLESHKPFHWLADFYGIMAAGGFDVIIGNPPYVEYSRIRESYQVHGFATVDAGNLYAFVIEMCYRIIRPKGLLGMIVQLPMVCTDRMKPLREVCLAQSERIWFASFDDRPARLFDGLQHIRASVFISRVGGISEGQVFSSQYQRWYKEERPVLFDLLQFENAQAYVTDGAIPKIGDAIARSVLRRLRTFDPFGGSLREVGDEFYFHNAPQYWVRAMDFVPYFWNERGGEQMSTQVKRLCLPDSDSASAAVAVFNSSLFYWWFIIHSDGRHLNMREIEAFPIGLATMSSATKGYLEGLVRRLMEDLRKNARRKEAHYKTTGRVAYDEFYPKLSKPIIDEIDRVLAQHCGFTEEELDFIINYDIKYRMGDALGGEGKDGT
jgi:hypothetical protein